MAATESTKTTGMAGQPPLKGVCRMILRLFLLLSSSPAGLRIATPAAPFAVHGARRQGSNNPVSFGCYCCCCAHSMRRRWRRAVVFGCGWSFFADQRNQPVGQTATYRAEELTLFNVHDPNTFEALVVELALHEGEVV